MACFLLVWTKEHSRLKHFNFTPPSFCIYSISHASITPVRGVEDSY
uniref:Uncharacterized protein n=1 Tax=Oryza sativa subsp. japonica TaxID=39947 RepID=Q2QY73_ORYSJ|nr:hypothetical protein LOC_Os12g03619 [Oryza sativa Japonica Group]